jgi:hypothetical protein
VHGGVHGEDNKVIYDGKDEKNLQEFALFDFQACSWMRIKQAMTEYEDDVPQKPIHLTIGSLAYHTMTPVYDP